MDFTDSRFNFMKHHNNRTFKFFSINTGLLKSFERVLVRRVKLNLKKWYYKKMIEKNKRPDKIAFLKVHLNGRHLVNRNKIAAVFQKTINILFKLCLPQEGLELANKLEICYVFRYSPYLIIGEENQCGRNYQRWCIQMSINGF